MKELPLASRRTMQRAIEANHRNTTDLMRAQYVPTTIRMQLIKQNGEIHQLLMELRDARDV